MTLTQKTPFWKSAFAVFLAALLLRLIFAWGGLTSGDDRFARPDTDSYLAPAHSLVCSGTYCGVDGKPTAHRTPGLPILLAVLSYFGQRTFFSFVLLFMGSLTVFPVYALCRKFAPPGASAAATMLFAQNPTSIAHAPLLLSDTFSLLFGAFALYFLASFLFGEEHDPFWLFASVLIAVFGTLVRPSNLFWIVPCVVCVLFVRNVSFGRRILLAAGAGFLFLLCLFPWIWRNHSIGAGWRLDASSAITMIHNASAVESIVLNVSGDRVREKYDEKFQSVFAEDPERFATEDARLGWIEMYCTNPIIEHPLLYLKLTLRPVSFLPDVPTLLEDLGVTYSGRGTLDVLNREGFLAAVRYYFSDVTAWLLASIPLMLCSLVLYLAALTGLILALFRRKWMAAFCFFAFGIASVWITGPVVMPRYQLPALPVFCAFAAYAFASLKRAPHEEPGSC